MKTAVEWYENEIDRIVSMLISNQLSISRYNELNSKAYDQAKQMEKEQIENAFEAVRSRIIHKNDCGQVLLTYIDGKQYYNETYKNTNE